MQIKYQKSIKEYKYLLMFDLASKISGVCLWDIEHNIPIETNVLKVIGKHELPVAELFNIIDNYFQELNKRNILFKDILVCKEAMPTQLRGGSSTVQTFMALARSHAILDWYTYMNNIAMYDYIGVYPISTHAYLKKINGWDNNHPVQKTDIQEFVTKEYGLENLTLDESDSVFLAKTFIDIKWNKDLNEKIKEIKKHSKTLKAEHAINTCLDEINRLESLKR